MEEILKQNKGKSNKEFEKLLTEDLGNRKFKEGEITTGTVEEIGKKFVFIDLGLKSSGAIPLEEFKLTKEIDKIEIGSKIDVLLEKIENKNGEIVISREKARRAKSWKKMEKAFENKEEVTGIIISKCKGGFIVNVDSCLCFLPASQLDLRPLKNFDHLMKVPQTFECVKLDKKRGVPADGEYVIRFSAKAVRRNSRYKDADLRYNSNEPMRLSISIDSRELGATAHRIIGEYEIPDDRVIEIEHRVWLEKGFTFHLHWANGPNGSFKRILRKVLPKYNKDALYPMRNPPEMYVGSGPELHINTLEIKGPFYEEWPPPGFVRFFPDPPAAPGPDYLETCLIRLANTAFRRPISAEEMKPYLNLAKNYLEEDLSPIGDMRASKEYRLEIAKNLLMKCFIEINSNKLTRVN